MSNTVNLVRKGEVRAMLLALALDDPNTQSKDQVGATAIESVNRKAFEECERIIKRQVPSGKRIV